MLDQGVKDEKVLAVAKHNPRDGEVHNYTQIYPYIMSLGEIEKHSRRGKSLPDQIFRSEMHVELIDLTFRRQTTERSKARALLLVVECNE
jgi:inorganic pyrophosphatase